MEKKINKEVGKNIERLRHEGYDEKQAIAIGEKEARKPHDHKEHKANADKRHKMRMKDDTDHAKWCKMCDGKSWNK